jgi:hypothetical protein
MREIVCSILVVGGSGEQEYERDGDEREDREHAIGIGKRH